MPCVAPTEVSRSSIVESDEIRDPAVIALGKWSSLPFFV